MVKIGMITALGLMYIALWVGISISSVGQIPKVCEEYPFWLPIEIFVAFAFPFALGYLGKQEEMEASSNL